MGYKIYDAHAHIFPAKIAEKATQSIGHFYDIPMHHLGSAEELLRRGNRRQPLSRLLHRHQTRAGRAYQYLHS